MQTKSTKFMVAGGSCILILILFNFGLISGESNINETELEISNIDGGLGGIAIEVKNTGNFSANDLSISTHVTGGLFDNIDLYHQCAGCDMCGTTLEPGMTKTENTREAGMLIGFGSLEITVIASASNAEEVSITLGGFIMGPFVIV